MKLRGFTLIELLVVIAIIGILATVVITSLSKARDRAKNARTLEDFHQIKTLIVGAQVGASLTLREMTEANSPGTYGSCPSGTDLSGLGDEDPCVTDWQNAIDRITSLYRSESSTSNFYRDVWGSPYLLNEGEGEDPLHPCIYDSIKSAGSDRIAFTQDDLNMMIPFESCTE